MNYTVDELGKNANIKKHEVMELKKFITILLSCFMGLIIFMSSCSKDSESYIQESEAIEVQLPNRLRAAENNKVVRSYGVSEDVLMHFRHYSQREKAKRNNRYCSPTAHMMAVACLLRYNKDPLRFSVSEESMLSFATPRNNSLFGVLHKDGFIEEMYPNIANPLMEPESRDDVKELLEKALENNYFPIVAVRANFSLVDNNGWFTKVESKNPDLTKNPEYLITTGGESAQHAIILLKIEKWSSGNGIVTYIDPYAKTRTQKEGGNRRYALYSNLLNSMNSCGTYNFSLVSY